MRCRGVGPDVAKRTERGAPLGDRSKNVQQIARRACQPIETGDEEYVTLDEGRDDAPELRPVRTRARRGLAEHLAGAGCGQLSDLRLDALAVG